MTTGTRRTFFRHLEEKVTTIAMMKHFNLGILSAMALLTACGASPNDVTELEANREAPGLGSPDLGGADLESPAPGGATAEEAPAELSTAALIDRVEWRGEELSFYDVTEPGDAAPGIVVSHLGRNSDVELATLLERQARYSVTPAELWLAATGDGAVPEPLLAQHLWLAAEEGRPEALQRFDLDSVQKSRTADPATMFPLTAEATGQLSGSNCWDSARITEFNIGSGTATDHSVCTGNGNFIRSLSISASPCSSSFNLNSTVRTAMHNGTGTTGYAWVGQFCFATGSGAWTCSAAQTVGIDFYFGTSFYKNGSSHRLGGGVTAPLTQGQNLSQLGTAILSIGGVPIFGGTTCH